MAYSSYYTHTTGNHPVIRRLGLARTFLHDLVNGYICSKYGLNRPHSNRAGVVLLPLLPPVRAAVDGMFRNLPRPPKGGGRLLDVGCGNGDFLALAREVGWVVEGIDADSAAINVARSRGLDALHVTVEAMDSASAESFDVITLSHVIEHVHSPVDLLRMLHRKLKPGGILWLETPNLSSLGHARYGSNWRDLDPPRHLVLFTPAALRRALSAAGFSEIRQRWRGMVLFSVFAASEAIGRNEDARNVSRQGKPPFRDVMSEFVEMMRPGRREFLTVTARK